MRPQVASLGMSGGGAQAALKQDFDALEDLGWNDMGADEEGDRDSHVHEAQVYSLTPSPANADAEAEARVVDAAARAEMAVAATEPEVLLQRRDAVATIGRKESGPVRRKASDASRRAAFTLRLDAKRHLKLRLASTVKNRSAQQLVTQALDKYLAEIPEIEALAAQVTRD